MKVTLGERTFDTYDWGLGGVRLIGFDEDYPDLGSGHVLYCTLPFQGFSITLKAEAEVVRHDTEIGHCAFRFTFLGERESALMQHFVEDLIRGKMTEVDDTIARIDTPVTPVPTKPDPNPVQTIPVRRWPVRQIMMTMFYFLFGTVVFGYAAVYFYSALFRLEVSAAVVASERVVVMAPVTGTVLQAPHREGDTVSAGTLLVSVEDANQETVLRQARAILASNIAELSETEALLAEEKRRAQGYALVARNNIRQSESQLIGLEIATQNARSKAERMRKLAAKGLALASDVEEAEYNFKAMESELDRKRIHIQELEELVDGGESVQLFTGAVFAGRVAEIEARVTRLRTELAFRKKAISELEKKRIQRTIFAPFDGRVAQIDLLPGVSIKQGDPVLALEEAGAEIVTAYLTQEEVLHIEKDSSAKLYITSEKRWIDAQVKTVDRTMGFVDEIMETNRFRAPDARSALVTLQAVSEPLPRSGTPITVYFERNRNNVVWQTIQQWLS